MHLGNLGSCLLSKEDFAKAKEKVLKTLLKQKEKGFLFGFFLLLFVLVVFCLFVFPLTLMILFKAAESQSGSIFLRKIPCSIVL